MINDLHRICPWIREAFGPSGPIPSLGYPGTDYFSFLFFAAILRRAKSILELGTGGGTSLGAFTAACEYLRHFEPDFNYRIVTISNMENEIRDIAGYYSKVSGGRVVGLLTDANSYVPDYDIDLLYLDDGHESGNIASELRNCAPRVVKGGAIAIDDINLNSQKGEMEAFLSQNPNYSSVVLPFHQLDYGTCWMAYIRKL